MIRKLRIKLIAVCMFSVFVVLFVILGSINLVSYYDMVDDADRTLEFLAENGGRFPMIGEIFDLDQDSKDVSPEMARASRYFWVGLSETGDVSEVDVSGTVAVDRDTAV